MIRHWALLLFLATSWAAPGVAMAVEPGAYRMTYWQTMPHLERYATPRTLTLCLETDTIFPVLAGNGAFDQCEVTDRIQTDTHFSYNLVCPGRAGARAQARYKIGPDLFRGKIAVKLGAKNMTMIEYQSGERIGPSDTCAPTGN